MLRLITHIITCNVIKSGAIMGGHQAVHTNVIETDCEDYPAADKAKLLIDEAFKHGIGAPTAGEPYAVSVHVRHVILPKYTGPRDRL